MALQKAKKVKLYPKVLLDGASGSGKTYSALRLATGYNEACKGGGVAVIDTENGRANYYADEFDFGVVDDLGHGRREDDKYSPESYIDAIQECIDAGASVCIIDSLSHEWSYLNRVHDSLPGNSFQNWRPLKARHSALFEYILQAPICIIATARSKQDYSQDKDDKGKTKITKLGLAPVQDSQIEYEYTVTFNLVQETHVATTTKDNTHLFEGNYQPLNENDGKRLYQWANSGIAAPTPKKVVAPAAAPTLDLDSIKREINEVAKTKIGAHHDEVMAAVKKYSGGSNPAAITELDKAQGLLKELQSI